MGKELKRKKKRKYLSLKNKKENKQRLQELLTSASKPTPDHLVNRFTTNCVGGPQLAVATGDHSNHTIDAYYLTARHAAHGYTTKMNFPSFSLRIWNLLNP